ncbi:MAG TPA: type II secretion system protein [Blastocatellia bacterium]|nr:type II secretion system protein [Blastocatellia bacterium]
MNSKTHTAPRESHTLARRAAAGERGYALLGLILTLAIMSIYLVSSVVPNVKMQVQRSKEEELIYRGNQIAKAIARYYGSRALRPLQIRVPPPYGYLTDLKKLRDGVTLGVTEVRFARASELIDPMTGVEWVPVRARDPRIMGVLQAYAFTNNWTITPDYSLIAGPPVVKHATKKSETVTAPPQGTTPGQAPGAVVVRRPPNPNNEEGDDDDDDDDDTEINDPLGHLFKTDDNPSFGQSNIPIVGVAPKLKGKAIHTLYGLENYEEWVFIYFPPPPGVLPSNPNFDGQQPGTRLRTSP